MLPQFISSTCFPIHVPWFALSELRHSTIWWKPASVNLVTNDKLHLTSQVLEDYHLTRIRERN